MRQLLLRKGEGRNDVLGLAMALRSTRYDSLHTLTLYYLIFDMTAVFHILTFLYYVEKVISIEKNVTKNVLNSVITQSKNVEICDRLRQRCMKNTNNYYWCI